MAESSQAGVPSDLQLGTIDLRMTRYKFLVQMLLNAQTRLKENDVLRKYELRHAVEYMYPAFQEDDKKKLNDMKTSFYKRNALTIVLSGVNVFLVAAYFKRVLKYSLFKKCLFGGGVFFTSYELGMYFPKRNMSEFMTNLLLKYKEEFLSRNLNFNK